MAPKKLAKFGDARKAKVMENVAKMDEAMKRAEEDCHTKQENYDS
jgi:hypothetical protein